MLARLGDVLYWASLATTVLCIVWIAINSAVLFSGSTAPNSNYDQIVGAMTLGIAAYLLGRACRYVLAGR